MQVKAVLVQVMVKGIVSANRFVSSVLMILLLTESPRNSQQFPHNGLDHSIDDGSNGGVESLNDIASGADVDEAKNTEESQSECNVLLSVSYNSIGNYINDWDFV